MRRERYVPVRFLRAAAVCAGLLGAVALAGCKGDNEAPAAPAATYTVRGEIKSLPGEGAGEELFLHHEAIPEFVDIKGEQVGMMSMSMPFGVVSEVSLDGLAAGDKVEATFAVHWDRNPPARITAIRKLPADTQLELSEM